MSFVESTAQLANDRAPYLVAYCKTGEYFSVHVATFENTFDRGLPGYENVSPEEAYTYLIELCRDCASRIPAVDIIKHEEFHEIWCYSSSLYSEQEVCDGHQVHQVYCIDCHSKCINYRQLENCQHCSLNTHLYGKLEASWIPPHPPRRQ